MKIIEMKDIRLDFNAHTRAETEERSQTRTKENYLK